MGDSLKRWVAIDSAMLMLSDKVFPTTGIAAAIPGDVATSKHQTPQDHLEDFEIILMWCD